jgi:hypothetical protein
MEMSVTCPKCNEQQDFELDLREVIDQYGVPDFDKTLKFSDLEVFFRPLSYHEISQSAQKQFEQQKKIQLTANAENVSDQDKLSVMSSALEEVTKMTMSTMIASIAGISSEGQYIEDPEQIGEFIRNIDRTMYAKIRDHLTDVRGQAEMKPLSLKCKECSHDYKQPFTLDMSNFFVSGS